MGGTYMIKTFPKKYCQKDKCTCTCQILASGTPSYNHEFFFVNSQFFEFSYIWKTYWISNQVSNSEVDSMILILSSHL